MGTIALNKIIAVEKGEKSKTYREISDIHKKAQKGALFSGIARTYSPKDDEGDTLPSEQTRVQLRATDVIDTASESLARLFDVVATKDWGNQTAKADIVVDGETILSGAPVTYLLFLEKQLSDLKTFIEKLPVLDQSEVWEWDENAACYATKPVETHRTKKVPRTLVKAEATEHHPAQVDVWHEDVIVGYWKTIKFCGALPVTRVKELQSRVAALQRAVKYAREEANTTKVEDVKTGEKLLGWLFR